MEAAFSWIGDLVAWFAALIPRWDICRATHGGVKFVRGHKILPIKPGIFWYWPAVTECVIVPTARQSFNIPPQSLTTKDGKTVLVSVVLVAKIVDVVKALGMSWDVDDTVTEVGGAAAIVEVGTRTWKEIRDDLADGTMSNDIEKRARRLLRPYGVQVLKGRLTDCALHSVIRTVGSDAIIPAAIPDKED